MLTLYFGEGDARKEVRVCIGADEIGYLRREDLYMLMSSSEKGIGASDYSALPGTASYRLTRLRCPVASCAHRLLAPALILTDPVPLKNPDPSTARWFLLRSRTLSASNAGFD